MTTARSALLSRTLPVAFVALIAGPNLPNPLLRLYGESLHLDTAGLSIVFSAFVVALIITLAAMTITGAQARPGLTLILAFSCSIAADLAFCVQTHPSLLVGRILNGVSIGLGTGAVAAIGLALRGERSRTITATGTMLGGVVGTIFATLVAQFAAAPLVLGFVVHASVIVVMLVLLVIGLLRWPQSRWAIDTTPAAPIEPVSYERWTGFALGSFTVIMGGLVVSLVPLAVGESVHSASILVANLGSITLLIGANVGQQSINIAPVRTVAGLAIACMGVGMVMIAAAVSVGVIWLVVVGCFIVGLGQGSSYRLGLRIVSAGLTPRQQGVRASVYGCITYIASALFVVLWGVTSTQLGLEAGLWVIALTLLPAFAVVAIEIRRRRVLPVVPAPASH